MPFFPDFEGEDDEFRVQRAADVLKQAAEIQADPDLLAKATDELMKQKDSIEEALGIMPEILEEGEAMEEPLDPDDEDSRVSQFLKRLSIDRKDEARKTNESPSERRRRKEKSSRKVAGGFLLTKFN